MNLDDYAPEEALHVLVYGKPGKGKTVFSHTFPRPRTLDLDNGMSSVKWAVRQGIIDADLKEIEFETILENMEKGKVSSATAFDRTTDTLDEWLKPENIDDWDTLIVDSATALSEYAMNKALQQLGKMGMSKTAADAKKFGIAVRRRQDWGAAMSLVEDFVSWIRTLNKNVVFICHEYENTSDEGTLIGYEPLLIGQLRQRIPKAFSEVYYADVVGPRNNQKYILQTQADHRHICKTRLGCLPIEIPQHYDEIRSRVDAFWKEESK